MPLINGLYRCGDFHPPGLGLKGLLSHVPPKVLCGYDLSRGYEFEFRPKGLRPLVGWGRVRLDRILCGIHAWSFALLFRLV